MTICTQKALLLGDVLSSKEETNWFCVLVCKTAKREEDRARRTGAAAKRHSAPVAPASERQRPAAAKARLGHPTDQRAGKLQRTLSAAAGSGKLKKETEIIVIMVILQRVW